MKRLFLIPALVFTMLGCPMQCAVVAFAQCFHAGQVEDVATTPLCCCDLCKSQKHAPLEDSTAPDSPSDPVPLESDCLCKGAVLVDLSLRSMQLDFAAMDGWFLACPSSSDLSACTPHGPAHGAIIDYHCPPFYTLNQSLLL